MHYFEGHYCKDENALNAIRNESDREVLQIINKHYPRGITKKEIAEEINLKRNIKSKDLEVTEDSVHPHLITLRNAKYIIEDKTPDRGSGRAKTHRAGQRRPYEYYVENKSFVLNASEDYAFQFAPGYIKYNPKFLYIWDKLVEEEHQKEIYPKLVDLLKQVFRKIDNNPKDYKIKDSAPRERDMYCKYCEINHEARDFIRAILLQFIDRFELSDEFIEFKKTRKLLTEETYERYKETSENFREKMKNNEESISEESKRWWSGLSKKDKERMEIIMPIKKITIQNLFEIADRAKLENKYHKETTTNHLGLITWNYFAKELGLTDYDMQALGLQTKR